MCSPLSGAARNRRCPLTLSAPGGCQRRVPLTGRIVPFLRLQPAISGMSNREHILGKRLFPAVQNALQQSAVPTILPNREPHSRSLTAVTILPSQTGRSRAARYDWFGRKRISVPVPCATRCSQNPSFLMILPADRGNDAFLRLGVCQNCSGNPLRKIACG